MSNVTINQLPLLAQGSIAANADTLALQHDSTTQSVTPEAATLAALAQTTQNVGIGVTPSAWSTKAIQFIYGAVSHDSSDDSTQLSSNSYYNAGWKYIQNYSAARYDVGAGQHRWYTAPTGTAGNAISFTQAMTLDASGKLVLGATATPYHKLGVSGSGVFSDGGNAGDAGGGVYFAANSVANNPMSGIKGVLQNAIGPEEQGGIAFLTRPVLTAGQVLTERARIDSGGSFLIGTSTTEGQGGLSILPGVSSGATRVVWNRSSTPGTTYALDFKTNGTTVGAVSYTNTATSYNTSSDYRLKNNQQPLTGSGEFIDALQPKTWEWTVDGSKGVGFLAHEVQEVSPASVVGEKDAIRVEQYEISPAVPATYDEDGNELTPAVPAVMGEREVPAYQAMEYGSAEFIANIIAELQSLRKRVAALEGAAK